MAQALSDDIDGVSGGPWGWQQPECKGTNAVSLFIDDLQRVLAACKPGDVHDGDRLAAAQGEVDMLLGKYVQLGAAPQVFGGQSVELKLGVDKSGVTHVVPIFSASLKRYFMQMLGDPRS